MPDVQATSPPALADGHHLARGAAGNALVLLAANFRGIFTFLIARLLGEAASGRFGVAFLATELLSKIGMLGLDSGVVPVIATRAGADDGPAARHVYRRALAAGGLTSVVLAVVSFGGGPWILSQFGSTALPPTSAIMFWALPGIAVARISFGAARALLSMRNEFYARGLMETWVTIGVFVAALALGTREAAPALAVVAGTSASAALAFVLARRALARVPDAGSGVSTSDAGAPVPFQRALQIALPTAGSNLLNVLVTQADVLLLMFYVGRVPGVTLERVGIFWVVTEIAVGLRKVRQVFDPIFAPIVANRMASADRLALRDTVAAPGRWVLAAQLPLVGGLLLSSGAVLAIYGSGFRDGALWLAMLALAHGTNSFAGLVETLLMIERPTLNVVNAGITVAIQLAAGIALIPHIGVTGAAVAMCLGIGVQSVLRFVELRHVYGWSWPWRSLIRPLAAFTVSFGIALVVRVLAGPGLAGEITAGLLFLGLYVLAWWKLGADPDDRAVWNSLLASRRRGAPTSR